MKLVQLFDLFSPGQCDRKCSSGKILYVQCTFTSFKYPSDGNIYGMDSIPFIYDEVDVYWPKPTKVNEKGRGYLSPSNLPNEGNWLQISDWNGSWN